MKKFLIIVASLIVLYVAWYLISPLFITIEVNEALPENIVTHDSVEGDSENIENKEESSEFSEVNGNLVGFEAPVEIQEESVQSAGSEVIGTAGHPASGTVQVINTSTGPVIRYQDFETINGPSLHVYLANDLEAKDYVDLGPIKGTKGNINYEVPEGVNIEDFKYVMYWCEPFSVLFNYAEI